ncbi:MAG: S46 family peptidase [Rikenellaceae bacterium]|nr:S46 family peptidase [Rikenellaceae bacterium]
MKRIVLTFLACFTLLGARADEGMWLPSLIGDRIKDMRAKGFKLSAEDIYSINNASMKDAVVLFDGGCTGEYVSENGLLLTNHHCGYDAIQQLSSVEHDYLTDGFWAKSQAEELPVPGLNVMRLVRMEDVTERLAAGESKEDIIVEAKSEGYVANIQSLYYGNQQFLYVYEVFTDVRLVAAPPSSIGKFGGDTDNWIWPRHTGDFSIFRVYADKDNCPAGYAADNQPYRPARHFKISTKGVKEGDFTMIYGFPGNTQEYVISDAVKYVAEVSDPMKIELRTERLNIISEAQSKSAEVRIKYAAKHASIANAWKKWQGEVLGIKRLGTVEKKRAYEREFEAWAKGKPEYENLLDSMRTAYANVVDWYYMGELYSETGATILLGRLARLASAEKPRWDVIEGLYGDYDVDVERELTQCVLKGFERYCLEGCFPEALRAEIDKYGGTIDSYVDYLYTNSLLLSLEKAKAATQEELKADPAFKLYGIFVYPKRMYRNISNVPEIERWYRTYMKALREWDTERAFYPDANLTLRVAYGSVAGYEYADGEYHHPVTTLEGIMEKDNPEIYDYNIPQVLRDIYASKDYGRWGVMVNGRYTVPVCLLATNHTTGGNSGSPIINGRGELIGINFDRTWRSTMSDIEFDPTICRNISVDIRYVLFVIDKVGGASYLIDEMDLK